MLKTMIIGANGKMGQIVGSQCEHHREIEIVAGVERKPAKIAKY